jgi:hypothetical protein
MKTRIELTLNRKLNESAARYRVTKVVNLTTPLPGDRLKKSDVDTLLADDRHDSSNDLTVSISQSK